ncbi:hypothetical protein [Fluviibacterium sp. S390]|uniref:hypothetical protein n=1 Tax=Fluviibacterium sp. S390 TaxID=3415139 RepID=UPI003C7E24DE
MRFAFVEEHRNEIPVARLCKIMDVSPRGYRAWRRRLLCNSQRNDMVVLAHIREQFALSPLSRWIQQERKNPEKPTAQSDLEHEVAELRRENRQLREERDVLKKATVFFAERVRT